VPTYLIRACLLFTGVLCFMSVQAGIHTGPVFRPVPDTVSKENTDPCAPWSERLTVAMSRWEDNKLSAHRGAKKKLPDSVASKRNAIVVSSQLIRVEVVPSPSKAGAWQRYRSEAEFDVTFRKRSCDDKDHY
jgi:hypothetical protein